MFVLTRQETDVLASQSVIPGRGKLGGAAPYAFTEQGVAMLSSVLHSRRAVQVLTTKRYLLPSYWTNRLTIS